MFLKYFKKMALSISGWIDNETSSQYIFYHDVHSSDKYTDMSTHLDLFMEHISVIRKCGYEIVNVINKEKGQITIGFDDGFKGVWDNFQYFVDNKIPFTIYLVYDYLDRDGYLTAEQVSSMLSTGLVTIGSHTITHNDLNERERADISHEIFASKVLLEQKFGIAIESICFPRGIYSKFVLSECEKAGYKLFMSSVPGPSVLDNKFKYRNLVQSFSANELTSVLRGALSLFKCRYIFKHKYNDPS